MEKNRKLPKKFRMMLGIKAVLSTLLGMTFLVVMITGLLLVRHMGGLPAVLQAPAGIRLHIIAGLLMGFIVMVHFALNFRFYMAEWKCLLGGASVDDLPAGHIIVKMMQQ